MRQHSQGLAETGGMMARQRRDRALMLAGLALIAALAGILYALSKSVFTHEAEADYRFLWTAGDLWRQGLDPYSADYGRLSPLHYPSAPFVEYWLYPPSWWPIARALAAFTPDTGLLIWRSLSFILLVGGSALLAAAATVGMTGIRRVTIGGFYIALACLIEATPQCLAMGQTSILIYFALCLIGFGLYREKSWPVALGVMLAIAKPQMGLVMVCGLIVTRRWRWPAIGGCLLALLCAMPQFAAHGVMPTVHGFLDNLARHATIVTNLPIAITGIGHFAWLFGMAIPATVATLIGGLFAAIGGFVLDRRGTGRVSDRAALQLAVIAAGCFALELHSYDMMWLVPLTLAALHLGRRVQAMVALSAALLIRPQVIEHIVLPGMPVEGGGNMIRSIAVLLAFVAAITICARRRSALAA